MQLLSVDKKNQILDKNQMDNSQTKDSFTNIYNQDEISKIKEKGVSETSPRKRKENNGDNEEMLNLVKNLKKNKNEINLNMITFKKRLSLALCGIYLFLFLISIPKIAIKIGKEEKIDLLINNNNNTHINILINEIPSLFDENKTVDKNSPYETKGYLIEFVNNKAFIRRWIIGFIYFALKCFYFIYSNNNNALIDEKKVGYASKLSLLIFPLILFYFDLKNNISYIEIYLKHIEDKTVSFYIMKKIRFSFIDYVEGLIPTIFTFLINIDYNNLQRIINTYIYKKEKEKKLI